MYAIVEIAGQQYKVEKDQQLFVHRLEGKEGSKVNFDNVLLTANGDKIEVGAPAVKGVSVSAKIIEHLKGDKVIVFKKKRRKGYKVRNGHRQYMTKIQIDGIGKATAGAKASAKKETPKAESNDAVKAAAKPAAKKTTAKASTATETKKAAPKATKAATATKTATAKKATAEKKAEPKKATPKKTAARTKKSDKE